MPHDNSLIDWRVNNLIFMSLYALLDEVLANATTSTKSAKKYILGSLFYEIIRCFFFARYRRM